MVVVREQEVYLVLFENNQLDHMIEFKLRIMEISMRLSLKISTQSDENIAPLI
jgi:rRNA-processing protein FCF1